jgi:hypothetical protein
MRYSRTRLALVAAITFFLGANLAWVRLDRAPPPWDDSVYLTSSLAMGDAQADHGVAGFAREFFRGNRIRPPLLDALAVPIYLVAGRTYRAAYAINLVFLAVLFATLYRLGKRYASPRAGWLAVWIAGTMPILYGLSRSFLVECGLVTLVAIVMCLVAGWEESSGAGRALAIGLVCGLGLLTKASFPIYVALPLLYLAVTQRESVMRAKPLLAFAAPIVLLAAPWYLINFKAALRTALENGTAETAKLYGLGPVLSLTQIQYYLHTIANAGPALYFAAAPLLALAARLIPDVKRSPGAKTGLRLCALWMAPLLFLTFSHYRDVRYAAPLYPALALILAILADGVLRRWGAKAGACVAVLLLLPLLSLLQVSFGMFVGPAGAPFELGGLLMQSPYLSYARRFDRTVGPQEEILLDLYHRSKFSGGERKVVLVGTDKAHFNADNFKLTAAQRRLPFDIETTAYAADQGALLPFLDAAAFFIYKEGGAPEVTFFNLQGDAAARLVRENGRFLEILPPRTLPDGGVVRVFEDLSHGHFVRAGAFLPEAMDQMPAARVTFGDRLQLTGFSMRRTPEGLEVQYRWRALQRIDRDFWCFVHVLGPAGDTILWKLDHPLLDGKPPVSQWLAGDTGVERLVLPLPPGAPDDLRLRFGVYLPQSGAGSGARLPINASSFPMAEEGTAVQVNAPAPAEAK